MNYNCVYCIKKPLIRTQSAAIEHVLARTVLSRELLARANSNCYTEWYNVVTVVGTLQRKQELPLFQHSTTLPNVALCKRTAKAVTIHHVYQK